MEKGIEKLSRLFYTRGVNVIHLGKGGMMMYSNLADLLVTYNGTCNPFYLFGNNEIEVQNFIKTYLAQIDKEQVKVKTYYDFIKDVKKQSKNLVSEYLENTQVFILGGLCEMKDGEIKEALCQLIDACILEHKQIILISNEGFDIRELREKNSILLHLDN